MSSIDNKDLPPQAAGFPIFKTVVGLTGECPRGTLESALCLHKNIHQKEETTCGAAKEVKEDATGKEADAIREEIDAARGESRKEDPGLKKETPEVPEGIRAATVEGETHGTREPYEVPVSRPWT
ncbi:hypothetical protein NDU88_002457 [Pleurodeles waltl]|uniref:Uncharacterized protein n=1 Tax=Pleurodeles waltl TaxID=8319 RepID=A0AAV7RAB6_PLEWA|nr:hypothetical protein NDU88_002457 [Pleurodeles waltl]